MPFRIRFSESAAATMQALAADGGQAAKLRRVRKAIGYLETNPRHPGLNTHRYLSKQGPGGEAVFEAYVENQTPGAWRIWFWYGPEKDVISILAIGPHPD